MTEVRLPRVLSAKEARAMRGQPVLDRDLPLLQGSNDGPTWFIEEDTDQPFAIVTRLTSEWRARLRNAILQTKMTATARTGTNMGRNLGDSSRTFGWQPQRPMAYRESCRATAMAAEYPDQHRVLEELAVMLTTELATLYPERAAADREIVTSNVTADWRLAEEAMFTSGVINKSFQLPYHYDSLNFDTWSAMPTLRRGMRGGHLHLPEYGHAFACDDGDVVWFCGRRVLHGVTPMYAAAGRQTDKPYRYSVVFYALRGFKDCATHAVEMAESARRRTERERRMAARLKEDQ